MTNFITYHQIVSGNAVLATQVIGDGNPVVFLHANVCDSRMWHLQMKAIGCKNKAISFDRRGFGKTHTDNEDYSAVADLMTIIDCMCDQKPAILVGCSQGGRIALDAAILHPTSIRALVLFSSSVSGSPETRYPPEIHKLFAQQKEAEQTHNFDLVNKIKARLWLDGPLAAEGRINGHARRLFLDMNAIVLRSQPYGLNLDTVVAFPYLNTLKIPTLVIWGDLDFPHIQKRSRSISMLMPNGSGYVLSDTAHLPSLEQPKRVIDLLTEFISIV